MKKIGYVFLCLTFVLLLGGCSGKKEVKNVSEEMQQYGTAAVETADDFLDGKITADAALERLEHNHSMAEALYEKEAEEAGSLALIGTDFINDSFVEPRILLVIWAIEDKNKGTGTDEEIIEERNELAELVGMNER